MSDVTELDIETLHRAVQEAAALRARVRLQPAGGPGDKVFPPTFSIDRGLKYAMETRRVDGETRQAVLLDSVASQANRIEEALFEGWDDEEIDFPVLSVDFAQEATLEDLGEITALHAPHRFADALLRDAVDADGTPFRMTTIGKALTDATPKNCTAVYRYCPTALVLGCWDSTGPKGGMGSKFQRTLVSEIVGIGAEAGVKVGSRIDPAGIQANVDIYHHKSDPNDWTASADEAQLDKKKPKAFSRKGGDGKGKPSAINHGNVAPTVDADAGGVTLDHALQTVVLSFPALRRLRMQTGYDGGALAREEKKRMRSAGQTALAALAICGVVAHRQRGFDLRSRCALVPDPAGPLQLELLGADGAIASVHDVGWPAAKALLADAAQRAADVGLPWERAPLKLRPAPKLAALIKESRARAQAAAGDGDD